MCTIIGGFIGNNFGRSELEKIDYMIRLKGGDYTQVICFLENMIVSDKITTLLMNQAPGTPFLIFSRLTPEMEDEEVKILQPYKTITGNYITAHGTIPISDEFDGIIDTEIFRYDTNIEVSINKTNELNGKVSLIQYLPELKTFYGIHNGLGLYTYQDMNITLISNIQLTGSNYIEPMRYTFISEMVKLQPFHHYYSYDDMINGISKNEFKVDSKLGRPAPVDVIISLCSGGMDTILSTYDVVKENQDTPKVELIYFDWGTVASESEIVSIEKFLTILEDDFDNEFSYTKLWAKDAFKNILDISGLDGVRLQDTEAVGEGKHEAENAISYVPMRNTFLLLFAATYAEQQYPGKRVQFVLGANLTEGMVYLDNSTNYLSKISPLIRLAGQKTYGFEISAPYVNKTKTKMLELFALNYSEKKLFELLKVSFSCYFPQDNLPCGKCGSCLLREKAIQKYEVNVEKLNSLIGQDNQVVINRGQPE